ncbi:MAG: hypothetical protein O3A82_02165 [Verrucomicrobia bacterium]|nr:hypothetical protein [Verrucomicrobiota bacterium]MDA1045714.1 hypothetical protein [Verrucomicrobiota bacterium]
MGGEKGGLRTGLWERKNSLAKGRLILLTLALSNTSDKPIDYDAQAAGCNDSLLVKDSKGNIVPYRAEWCSTIGGDLILQPGDSLPLFYDFILEEQYDISRRGLYTVQFRGLAPVTKDGKTSAIPPSNTITIRMK